MSTEPDRRSVPQVGDTITTAEHLDALPSLTIAIDANEEVQQRHGHLATERGDYSAWLGVMPPTCKPSPEVALPATVLYVPGEQPRPSVTDNARAALFGTGTEEGALSLDWPPEDGTPYSKGVVEGYSQAVNVVRATLDSLAAGRAETTTATTEDALAIRDRLLPDALAYIEREGLSPTGAVQAALRMGAEARLLATARTRPTREQIARALDSAGAFCGECGAEPGDFFDSCLECQRWLLNYADAVLALYADQPTEAEAGARALEQAATAWAEDPDAVGDSEKDARNWLRDRADQIRKGGER